MYCSKDIVLGGWGDQWPKNHAWRLQPLTIIFIPFSTLPFKCTDDEKTHRENCTKIIPFMSMSNWFHLSICTHILSDLVVMTCVRLYLVYEELWCVVRMGYSPAFRQPRSVTFMIILLFQYSQDVSGRSGPGLRRFRPKENSGRSAGVLCHWYTCSPAVSWSGFGF